MPTDAAHKRAVTLAAEAHRLRDEGRTVPQIARVVERSTRQVSRWLAVPPPALCPCCGQLTEALALDAAPPRA